MSGGGGKASKQAAAIEAARQASIQKTQGAVNAVFESPQRESDIQSYIGGLRDYYGQDLNRQKTVNDRELKFALARGGQTGSSTQRDQQKLFGEDFSRGVLNVERKSQGAGAGLRGQDQDARARLISLATSGLDATSASSMAASSMKSALESDRSTMMAQGIGDVFGTASKYYKDTKDAAERRRIDKMTELLYARGGGGGYGSYP